MEKKYRFVSEKEYPAEHALAGTHQAGEEVELDEEVAAPLVEDGTLEVVEEAAPAASDTGSEGSDNAA